MTLDDMPLYRPVWGPIAAPTIRDERQFLFMNLILTYLLMGYEIGFLTEAELRQHFAGMFKGEAARRFWHSQGSTWGLRAQHRRTDRFVHVIDEQYKRALDAGPPIMPKTIDGAPDRATSGTRVGKNWRTPLGTLAGLAIGLALGARLRHIKANVSRWTVQAVM
jgi:hypothetical protein